MTVEGIQGRFLDIVEEKLKDAEPEEMKKVVEAMHAHALTLKDTGEQEE